MADGESQNETLEFQDFVTVTPELVKLLTEEQMNLAMEHMTILKALTKGNLTVKEIHALYMDSKNKTHTKTIKTIYRYMDTLEKAGLVKIAGHRKPTDSRMTEKLYCRAAVVFTLEESDRGPRWHETPEGKEDIRNTSQFVLQFFDVPMDRLPDFENLLLTYYSTRDITVGEMLRKLAKDEKLAEAMVKIGIDEFKPMASFLGMLGVLLNLSDFQEKVRKLLS